MCRTNWFSRSIAKWTFAFGCVAIGSLAMESQAYGHHPFRHHHGCFGSYGWGSHYHGGNYGGYYGGNYGGNYGGYYGGYSSFYGMSSSYYYPSLSFGYYPTYFAPVYYPPVYYAPAFAPCSTWGGVNFNVGFPVANTSTSSNLTVGSLAATNQGKSPLSATQTRPFTKVNESVANNPGVKLVSNKPALLQPYSPIWTKAAAGIVDDMVAAGELDHAHSSCKSMKRITQPKGSGVYLRQALLCCFSTDAGETQSRSIDEILQLLELACAAGSQVQPSELAKDSLRDYFSACSVDVNGTMERLSKSVLESPKNSGRELLLLSALLKLDGQPDHAKLFANEVGEQVARSGSFRWNSLLEACLN